MQDSNVLGQVGKKVLVTISNNNDVDFTHTSALGLSLWYKFIMHYAKSKMKVLMKVIVSFSFRIKSEEKVGS
jgi:hypothetical protein